MPLRQTRKQLCPLKLRIFLRQTQNEKMDAWDQQFMLISARHVAVR